MFYNGWVYEKQPTQTLIKSIKLNINNCNSLKRLTAIAYTLCQTQFIMKNLEWLIGGIMLGYFVRSLIEVMIVIFKNAWKKYKEQDKVD